MFQCKSKEEKWKPKTHPKPREKKTRLKQHKGASSKLATRLEARELQKESKSKGRNITRAKFYWFIIVLSY